MRRRTLAALVFSCSAGCAAALPVATPEETRLTAFLTALAAVESVEAGRDGEGAAADLEGALRALETPGEVMRAVDWLDQTRALVARESDPLHRSQAHVLGCGGVVLRCETDHLSRTMREAAVAPAPVDALASALGDPDFRVAADAAEGIPPPWNGAAARTFQAACVQARAGSEALPGVVGRRVAAAAALVAPEPPASARAEAMHARLDLFLPAREPVAAVARARASAETPGADLDAGALKQRLAALSAARADARPRELAALPVALADPALSLADRVGVLRRLLADPAAAAEAATAIVGEAEGAGRVVRRLAAEPAPAVHGAVVLAFPVDAGLPVFEALLRDPPRVRAALRAALNDPAIRVRVEAARRWLAAGWSLGAYDPRLPAPAALAALDAPTAGEVSPAALGELHKVMETLGVLVGAFRRAREVENARAIEAARKTGKSADGVAMRELEPDDLDALAEAFPGHRLDGCERTPNGGLVHIPSGWRLALGPAPVGDARVILARPPKGAAGAPCWFDPIAGLVRTVAQ